MARKRITRSNYPPVLLLCAYCLSLAASMWVYDTLTNHHVLPTTDLGQWIMYSRYYAEETAPAYRDSHGISPLIPFVLSLLTHICGSAVLSAVLVTSTLYFMLTFSAFLVANELFKDGISSIISLFLIGFAQHFFVYLTAFGGVLQLSAICGMNIGLIALLKIGNNYTRRQPWLMLSLSCFIVGFSHLPTMPIFILSLLATIVFLVCAKKVDRRIFAYKVSAYLFFPLITSFLYFIWFFEQEIEYTTNKAGYYLLGLDTLQAYLTRDGSTVSLVILALMGVAFSIVYILRAKSEYLRKSLGLLLIWLFVPLVFMVVSYAIQIGTDYQRFIYYFIEPPLFALSFTLSILAKYIYRRWLGLDVINYRTVVAWISGTVAVLLVSSAFTIIISSFFFTVYFYSQVVNYFSPKHGLALLDIISWLNRAQDRYTILAPSLPEANWIEGLTGRSTVFPNKFRLLYRAGLVERSIAADLITTGTDTVIENGLVFLRFRDITSYGSSFDPNIALFYKGEYFDALTYQDRLTTIHVTIKGITYELNLERDFHRDLGTILMRGTSAEVVYQYVSTPPSNGLTVIKRIQITQDAPKVLINLHLSASDTMAMHQISLRFGDSNRKPWGATTINRADTSLVKALNNEVMIYHSGFDGIYPAATVSFSPTPSRVVLAVGPVSTGETYLESTYLLNSVTNANLTIAATVSANERFHDDLKRYNTSDLIQTYNIGYLLVSLADVETQHIYDSHGFVKVYSNRNYIIYGLPRS